MNSIIFILFCFIFLVLQQGIDAINCYSCGIGGDGCGPSFSKTGTGVVPGGNSSAAYCYKRVYASNTNAITRGFATTGTCTQQNYPDTTVDTTYYLYCCITDYCNNAKIGKGYFLFAIIPTIIAVLFIK